MSLVSIEGKPLVAQNFSQASVVPVLVHPGLLSQAPIQAPFMPPPSREEQSDVKASLDVVTREIFSAFTRPSLKVVEALELLSSTYPKLMELVRLYPFIKEVLRDVYSNPDSALIKDPIAYHFFVDVIYQIGLSYRIVSIQRESEFNEEEDVEKFSGITVVIAGCTMDEWRRANDLVAEMTRGALKRFGERVLEVYRMITVECADAYSPKT